MEHNGRAKASYLLLESYYILNMATGKAPISLSVFSWHLLGLDSRTIIL